MCRTSICVFMFFSKIMTKYCFPLRGIIRCLNMRGCESLDPTLRFAPPPHFNAVGLNLGSAPNMGCIPCPIRSGGKKRSPKQQLHSDMPVVAVGVALAHTVPDLGVGRIQDDRRSRCVKQIGACTSPQLSMHRICHTNSIGAQQLFSCGHT